MPGAKDSFLAHVRDAAFHSRNMARSLHMAAGAAQTAEAIDDIEQLAHQGTAFAQVLTRAERLARSTPRRRTRAL